MFDFDYWKVKIIFDMGGYVIAAVATWYFYKKVFRPDELPNPFVTRSEKYEYYLCVFAGAMLGGMIISTFDGAMIPGRNPEE